MSKLVKMKTSYITRVLKIPQHVLKCLLYVLPEVRPFFTYLLLIYNINMLCAHDACLTLGLQTYIHFIKDG